MNRTNCQTLTSLRPSPLPPKERRGRIVLRHTENGWLFFAPQSLNFNHADHGCSLSPRVRANSPSLRTTSNRTGVRTPAKTRTRYEH